MAAAFLITCKDRDAKVLARTKLGRWIISYQPSFMKELFQRNGSVEPCNVREMPNAWQCHRSAITHCLCWRIKSSIWSMRIYKMGNVRPFICHPICYGKIQSCTAETFEYPAYGITSCCFGRPPSSAILDETRMKFEKVILFSNSSIVILWIHMHNQAR